MRLKIRTKVILIGTAVTLALMTVAFFVSYFIYNDNAKKNLLTSVDYSVDNMAEFFSDDIAVGYLADVREIILNQYNPEEAQPTDRDELYEFLRDKYGDLYNTNLGMYPAKSIRQNEYYNMASELNNSARTIGILDAFIAYYDSASSNFVYLVDCEYKLGTKYDGTTRFPGQYFKSTDEDEIIYDGGNYETYIIGSTKNRAYDVITEDDGYLATVFIEYDEQVVTDSINSFLITEVIALSVAALVTVIIFTLLIHFAFIKNMSKLRDSARKFSESASSAEGLTVVFPNVKSHDEMKDLSDSFVEMENEIIDYTKRIADETKEKERFNAELSIAADIQKEELPAGNYFDGKVKVFADFTAAKEVGGDFYDYFYLDENRFAVVIADVSGKGIPASLFMMKAKSLIKDKLIRSGDVESAVFDVNNALMENNKARLFVTAFVGVIDVKANVMECISAGHERPYLFGDGTAERLNVDANFVLGGVRNFTFKKNVFNLKNKKLFLFTDGLNESVNADNEEFGYARIEESLKNSLTSDSEVVETLKTDLKNFVGKTEAFDDVTVAIVSVGVKGKVSKEFLDPDYGVIEMITNVFNEEFSYADKEKIAMMDVVIDEIINNFVSYEKREGHIVTFTAEESEGKLIMRFTSNGDEFNPLSVKDKYIENADQKVSLGGFGITISKSLSDGLTYERESGKNVITVIKNIR